jgi:hypothetical protein
MSIVLPAGQYPIGVEHRFEYRPPMTKINFQTTSMSGLVLGTALLAAMIGCTKEAPIAEVAAAPAAVVAPSDPTPIMADAQDDYVYYPNYEVYYSSNHHQYRYRDGNAWVTRSAPPHVAVNVLFASPSVRMDFHDTPDRHHDTVVRSYPKNWSPPGKGREGNDDHNDDKKADDKKGDDKRHN